MSLSPAAADQLLTYWDLISISASSSVSSSSATTSSASSSSSLSTSPILTPMLPLECPGTAPAAAAAEVGVEGIRNDHEDENEKHRDERKYSTQTTASLNIAVPVVDVDTFFEDIFAPCGDEVTQVRKLR